MNSCDEIPYQFILDTCNDEVFMFDVSGHIIYCNKAAKLEMGYEESVIDCNIMDIFPKALAMMNGKITYLAQPLEDSEEESTCAFAYRKNRTCYPVRIKLTYTTVNETEYGILTAANQTKLSLAQKNEKLIREELEDANGVKNTFLANVTHELRTPVNGMKGLTTVLLDTKLTQEQLENVNIIRRCCDNMTNIIDQILDYSKITAGKLQLQEIEFGLRESMKNIISVHLPHLNEKGLKLQLNIGEDVPERIVGDELRLGQILNNLISNAIKFTSAGQIVIEIVNTYQSKEEIELFFMVIDSGIGISKDEMDKLFVSFSQVDGSITRKYGGTGLGLAISKQLIELMKGSIHVNSEKGKGSTFSFSVRLKLPQSETKKAKKEIEQSQNETQEETTKLYVNPNMKLSSIPNMIIGTQCGLDVNLVDEYLEKLTLCLELGIWEKAENFADTVKHTIPEDETELRKQAFRIELAVRKENYDKSMQEIEALRKLFS